MQTRSKLKNTKKINIDENEDNIKNKLFRNVEALNKVQKKRGRPRKIIHEVKLQEPIKKRGRLRKVINKSHENDKKPKFMESEDESDSDLDYDVKQKPKENNKKKHFKENKDVELEEEIYPESNSDLSSEDEKEEETQENFQNEESESENEQFDKLEVENSENSDEYDFREERLPPEPPPDLPSTSGLSNPQKNVIECRDQLTMRKDNKKINPQNFKIGDYVFPLEGGELKKFENQYSGPYEVLEIIGKGNIKILVKNKPKK